MANTEAHAVPSSPSPERSRSDVYLKAQPVAPRRVLVVDDEPLIRLFVARALAESGYDVLEAESAEQAMAMLATEGHSLCLLLSDVGLPGASGTELVAHAKRLFPSLPTQLMSGTCRTWLASEGVLAAYVDVLQKPFKLSELLDKVERLAR